MLRMLVTLLVVALPAGALAQGLGQAAARERDKRHKTDAGKPTVPSFSNDDLDSEKKKKKEAEEKERAGQTSDKDPQVINPASGSPQHNRPPNDDPDHLRDDEAAIAGDASSADGGSPDGGLDEATWRARAAEAWSRVQEVENQVGEAQFQLSQLRDRLNPMSVAYEQDASKLLGLQEELGHAQALVEARKQELASAQEEFAEFERQARLVGVPPGWLRPRP